MNGYQGQVVYIAGEGRDGYKKRLAAWIKHHGLTDPPDNFFLLARRFNFADPADTDKLLAMLAKRDIQPKLVVIDTLAKNLTGSDNDPESMNAFVASMDYIREAFPGCCVLTVHHAGKDKAKGARGFSGLPGGVDVVIEAERTATGYKLTQTKQKDAEELDPYLLEAVQVDLGTDEEGNPVNSLVLVPQTTATATTPTITSEQALLELDKAKVLSILPRLNGTPTEQEAMSRSQIDEKLGWTKNKTNYVLDHFEGEQSGPIRWTTFGTAKNAPRYYWIQQDDVQPDDNN